ncbi:MAG: LysR family transcriptional regulator, partial [Asticcacaulis sp.]|nr:LysR family transcriptional regulator [Asticcacaulis sp.]
MKTLPPLPVLQAFEAAARLGSFSRAARERHLTAGAISRHIQALEHWRGEPLFSRNGPHVALTEAGRALRHSLTEPLQALHDALAAPGGPAAAQSLHVFTLPSIAVSLLLPNLEAFRARHPHIRLSLLTRYEMMSLPPVLPVVAVRYGVFDATGLTCHRAPEEAHFAAATPAWLSRYGSDPGAWPAGEMLRHSGTPWPQRLGRTKLPAAEGIEFNDAALALFGGGVALGLAVSSGLIGQVAAVTVYA